VQVYQEKMVTRRHVVCFPPLLRCCVRTSRHPDSDKPQRIHHGLMSSFTSISSIHRDLQDSRVPETNESPFLEVLVASGRA